jgi:tetratricopeptide (TPR) repeat protein
VTDHPTRTELEGFVWNRLPAERARAIVSHLVLGCGSCLTALAPHVAGVLGMADPPDRNLSPREEDEYDAAIDRAFAAALRHAGKLEKARKREASASLAASPVEASPEPYIHPRDFPLFEGLLERSWALRHENPEEMVRLAERARTLAEEIDPGELGNQRVADLRCRAWVELGNAHRVADHLLEAEQALGRATAFYVQGTQDELLAARLFDVQASLLGACRRFDLAETALDLVFAIHRRRGDHHLAGRALISKGTYVGYQGDAEESVRLIEQGLGLIDPDQDPRLLFVALHNQARFLTDCGRLREARIALWKLKARRLDPGGRISELKVRWLEGQINARLGELDRAELALLDVKRGFAEAGLGYKAALAGLELGVVRLRRGRTDDAIAEVLAAVDVFQTLGIAREAAVSVLLLKKGCERRMADVALLEYVIGLLHRAEGPPAGRIEPPAPVGA